MKLFLRFFSITLERNRVIGIDDKGVLFKIVRDHGHRIPERLIQHRYLRTPAHLIFMPLYPARKLVDSYII